MRKLISSKEEAKIGEIGEKAAFPDSSQKTDFMQIAVKMEEKKKFSIVFHPKEKKVEDFNSFHSATKKWFRCIFAIFVSFSQK